MVLRLLSTQIILVLCVSPWGWASGPEEATDLTFILRANPIQISHQKQEAISFNPRESTPTRLFSTGLIRIYQKYISTQDLPACNFTPSCSRFGMGSIQKYGFFRGILLTADRLLRELGRLPDAMERTVALRPAIAEAAREYAPRLRDWSVVGNGLDRVAAEEVRIKLSELCYKAIACDATESSSTVVTTRSSNCRSSITYLGSARPSTA